MRNLSWRKPFRRLSSESLFLPLATRHSPLATRHSPFATSVVTLHTTCLVTYNTRLQLATLAFAKSGANLLSLAYNYGTGNNGQIQGITDNVDNGRTVNYTYDAWSRVKTAATVGSTAYPAWGLSWSYDRYGNRKQQNVTAGSGVPSNSVTPSPTTNRLTDTGYAYDLAGNMTADGLNTLAYDAENHLTSNTQAGATSTYAFDGKSLRVTKTVSGTTTVYVFSGAKVIAEYASGAAPSSPIREYIYSGSTLLAKIEGSVTRYYHQDHLSNRLVTDSTGTALEQMGHFSFGESWYDSGTEKWKFTSYERDAESANDYAMMRISVNRLGRFSSPDPLPGSLGDPQSLNRYSYARNDAANLADPTGARPTNPDAPGNDWLLARSNGCTIDGQTVDCSMASAMLLGGFGVQCPNNYCGALWSSKYGEFFYFSASANGGGAYFPSEGPGSKFSSEKEALTAGALWAAAATKDNSNENCGFTYDDGNGQYSFTGSVEGQHANCESIGKTYSFIPSGQHLDGAYHSHPDDPQYDAERFSGQPGDIFANGRRSGDVLWAQDIGVPLSLGTPEGRVIIYYPWANCQIFVTGGYLGTGTIIPICH